VLKERFPTNSLLLMPVLLSRRPLLSPDCSRTPGFKPSLNRVHLRISISWKRQAS